MTMTSRLESRIATVSLGMILALLFWAPLKWLTQNLGTAEYRSHSVLLIAFSLFLAIRTWRQGVRAEGFRVRPAPALTFTAGIIGFLITEIVFDIDVVSCMLAGLTIYGFSGFIMDPTKWRNSSVLVLLFFACLPLSYHFETFLGFPLRLFSAKMAGAFFSLLGNHVHSTETILLIENKTSHIDLPCSGIKSLWSITVFALSLSIAETYKVNSRWLLALVGGWLLTASANVFRIVLLVLVFNSELPEAAKQSLHAPIGLIGFIATCGATYWILRLSCQKEAPRPKQQPPLFERRSAVAAGLVLVVAISVKQSRITKNIAAENGRRGQNTQDSLPLTDKEHDLFLRHGVVRYEKKSFDLEGIHGTAFLVLSNSWRGHHHPEQCLQGQGLAIESAKTLVVGSGLKVRNVTIENSTHEIAYWFTSADDSTDDYSSRVWSGLAHLNKPYTMVSLYLENGKTADPSAFENLINEFNRQALVMSKTGGTNEEPN